VDRLIALVLLRWRLEARAVLGSRGRLLGLLVALPALGFLSLTAAFAAFAFARLAERGQPELVLPALSALAAVFGLTWALSPLLAGIAATETHDLGKLLGYPVSLPVLVASSLLANLLQPMVLAQLPPLAALAFGLGGGGPRALVALAGLALALSLVVASGQAVGLALHAISRHRRLHDRALLLGIFLGVALSLLPVVLLIHSGSGARRFTLLLLEHDVFALVPFAWGVRAAVHAGRGEALLFLGWGGGAVLALAAVLGVSSVLAQRLYRGELDVGEVAPSRARARMRLPGAVGAVVEKDLRLVWRDPRLKALVFTGVIGPILLLFVFWKGSAGGLRPGLLLALASFTGMGALGSNAFAFERQGPASSSASRGSLLDPPGKNLALLVLRAPALLALSSRRCSSRSRAGARGDRGGAHPGPRRGRRQLPLDPRPDAGGGGGAGPDRARLGYARARGGRIPPPRHPRDARPLGPVRLPGLAAPPYRGTVARGARPPARPRRGGGGVLHGDLGGGTAPRAARDGARRPHGGGGLRWRAGRTWR
jgi:ABC-2 type transport system permease protein